jgi:K+-sensing histidine kinase KdpD
VVVVDINILWFFLSSSLVVLMQAQALRLASTNRELAASEANLKGQNGELGSANEQLAELGVAKSEVLANVEYEFVAPLVAIVSAAELAKEDEESTVLTKRCLTTIVSECSNLERIVKSLPTNDELERRGLWWLEARVEVAAVIQTAASTMASVAKRSGVQLEIDCAEDLPTIWADHDRLVHVLDVLLDNTIMLSRAGGRIELGAKVTGPEVVLSVTQCTGSTRAFDASIFDTKLKTDAEPGENGDDGMSDGRLLWLRMCKEIVENRHGRIWAEPHESGGSVFKVAFSHSAYEARDTVYAS